MLPVAMYEQGCGGTVSFSLPWFNPKRMACALGVAPGSQAMDA